MINVGSQKLCFDEKLTPYFELTTDKQGTIKNLTMQQANHVKILTFDVCLKREFLDNLGEKKIIYLLQHMKAQIPNEKSYRYVYLYFEPKVMQNIGICYVDPTVLDSFGTHAKITTLLDWSDVQYLKPIGKPTKLSPEQLRLKLKNKEILAILKDDLRSQLAI